MAPRDDAGKECPEADIDEAIQDAERMKRKIDTSCRESLKWGDR